MSLFDHLPNLEALVTSGGEITLGRAGPVACAATACDEDQCLAMLVKGVDESLDELMHRLDAAIEQAQEHGDFIDEINPLSRP